MISSHGLTFSHRFLLFRHVTCTLTTDNWREGVLRSKLYYLQPKCNLRRHKEAWRLKVGRFLMSVVSVGEIDSTFLISQSFSLSYTVGIKYHHWSYHHLSSAARSTSYVRSDVGDYADCSISAAKSLNFLLVT